MNYSKESVRNALMECTKGQQEKFLTMYKHLGLDIDSIVSHMPESCLQTAMSQIKSTLRDNGWFNKSVKGSGDKKLMNGKAKIAMDDDMPLIAASDDCFSYGIWDGCDEGCPKMRRGECEIYDANFKER